MSRLLMIVQTRAKHKLYYNVRRWSIHISKKFAISLWMLLPCSKLKAFFVILPSDDWFQSSIFIFNTTSTLVQSTTHVVSCEIKLKMSWMFYLQLVQHNLLILHLCLPLQLEFPLWMRANHLKVASRLLKRKISFNICRYRWIYNGEGCQSSSWVFKLKLSKYTIR